VHNEDCVWEAAVLKRKTKWVFGLSLGIPILLIVTLLLVLRLSSSNPEADLTAIEIKEFPGVWEQEAETDIPDVKEPPGENQIDAPLTSENPTPLEEPEEAIILPPTIEAFDLPISGTLVLINGDKPFGEETFELSQEGDEVMLRSNGKFWFKALVATITLKYDQVLQLDSYLRPLSLASTFDAPLGFGRETQADFTDGRAIVRSGDNVDEYAVDLERAFVLGTFSTYAVIPLLYELREFEGEAELETLVFGGPPNSDEAAETDGLPETRISRIEDGVIQFDGREMVVSQYEISGSMGTMRLFARGIELLGLFAGDSEDSMFVYRADYFEDGFSVVEASSE
jgi:hypothetical protein